MPMRPKSLNYKPGQEHKSWVPHTLTAHQRGYGRAWQKIRQQVLMDEPLCRECKGMGFTTAADEVDHVKPKIEGGTDDLENLQPLCRAHHRIKSHAERLRGKARKKGNVNG